MIKRLNNQLTLYHMSTYEHKVKSNDSILHFHKLLHEVCLMLMTKRADDA